LEKYLLDLGVLSAEDVEVDKAAAEEFAADFRTRMNTEPPVDPTELFQHVYATPTGQLVAQREALRTELAAAEA
jgi:pyruvate dehydrogenase E1 component alpha subunit